MTTKTNAKTTMPAKSKAAPANTDAETISNAAAATAAPDAPDGPKAAEAPAAPKPPSKLAIVVEMLGREAGATIPDLMEATGWQSHSVRGALAGAVKKKGHLVVSAKTDAGRAYRIEKAKA